MQLIYDNVHKEWCKVYGRESLGVIHNICDYISLEGSHAHLSHIHCRASAISTHVLPMETPPCCCHALGFIQEAGGSPAPVMLLIHRSLHRHLGSRLLTVKLCYRNSNSLQSWLLTYDCHFSTMATGGRSQLFQWNRRFRRTIII